MRRNDDDLHRELDAHLELEEEERRATGDTPDEARRQARLALGNRTAIAEDVRALRPLAALERWWRDFRFALRSLRRNPGFALAAIASLGLGIGAASSLFSIADQALLRMLPVERPGELVLLRWEGDFIGGMTRCWDDCFSYPAFRELEATETEALSGIAARYQMTAAVEDAAGPSRATVESVSGAYFETLGVGAARGRVLGPTEDDERDGEPWVVLTDAYWRTRLAADPDVVGKTMRLNGFPVTVIGVADPGFVGYEPLRPADLFVSLQMSRTVNVTWDARDRRDALWLNVFSRLAPGASAEQAAAALTPAHQAILRRDLEAHPDRRDPKRYMANAIAWADGARGVNGLRDELATPLQIIAAMVGLLLLITCVNVAGLMVIRAGRREKEVAVRSSLGAPRWAVARLALTEALVLSAGGAALGLLIARVGVHALIGLIPEGGGQAFDPTLDARALLFTASLAVLAALLFGAAPALHATRAAATSTLRGETRALSLGRGQTRLRRSLVVAQASLSLILLATAGLLGKSLNKIFDAPTGMAVESLMGFAVDPSQQGYTPERSRAFWTDLQRRLEREPGVAAVGAAATPVLMGADGQNTIQPEGYQAQEGEDMQAGANQVTPGFFAALGVPLLAGRDFDERDVLGAPRTLVVNAAFAERFFGSAAEAVGRRVGYYNSPPPLPYEIIGVVADHKARDLRESEWPRTYFPALQTDNPGQMTFYLRASGDPRELAASARRAVADLAPSLPVFRIAPVERQMYDVHFMERLMARLSAAFAAMATLLAAVGLYGIAAFSVARRTREIGVRLALGAERRKVFGMILREVLTLAALGVAAGVPAAFALGKLLESQLYGVGAIDWSVAGLAVGALLATGALAAFAPALKAMRISPVNALRHE